MAWHSVTHQVTDSKRQVQEMGVNASKIKSMDDPSLIEREILERNAKMTRTYEELLDERAIHIDLNKKYPDTFSFSERDGAYKNAYCRSSLTGIYNPTPLARLFFSDKNMANLDAQIRYTVYLMSHKQYKLGPQRKVELAIVMRSVYLNYAPNWNFNLAWQVNQMNKIVIQEVAPEILEKATQHLKYLEDVNESHRVLLPLPVNSNNKGLKTLYVGNVIGM